MSVGFLLGCDGNQDARSILGFSTISISATVHLDAIPFSPPFTNDFDDSISGEVSIIEYDPEIIVPPEGNFWAYKNGCCGSLPIIEIGGGEVYCSTGASTISKTTTSACIAGDGDSWYSVTVSIIDTYRICVTSAAYFSRCSACFTNGTCSDILTLEELPGVHNFTIDAGAQLWEWTITLS